MSVFKLKSVVIFVKLIMHIIGKSSFLLKLAFLNLAPANRWFF
mgnify:CR=1 FL=1